MLKNITRLEHKIGNRSYQLLCDQDSPIGEVKDALCQFMGYIANVEKVAREEYEAKKAQEEMSEVNEKIVPIEKVD